MADYIFFLGINTGMSIVDFKKHYHLKAPTEMELKFKHCVDGNAVELTIQSNVDKNLVGKYYYFEDELPPTLEDVITITI